MRATAAVVGLEGWAARSTAGRPASVSLPPAHRPPTTLPARPRLLPCSRRFAKGKPAKKIPGKFGLRFYKNIGLGFKTPKEAMEGARRAAGAGMPWAAGPRTARRRARR